MTKDQIQDYLYFFWAPLLKAKAVAEPDIASFQQMIILTLSQASAYIEAPGYVPNQSNREFEDEVISEVNKLADKITANIPDRTTQDSYWLRVISQPYFSVNMIRNTQLGPEASFGPYSIEDDTFISFDFYYLPYQLQLRLPTTAEVSAIISSKKPFDVPDGDITDLHIEDCALWLSIIHFDADAGNATFYTGMRLKDCQIHFDSGYTKAADKIATDLLNHFAGFVITCIPENSLPAGEATIASGITLNYPDKFVFSFKHRPGLPQPPKIALTHIEPFTVALFGNNMASDAANNVTADWHTDKNLLSFPLTITNSSLAITENSSPVFKLQGNGNIKNAAWYMQPVSTAHTLGFLRLGMAGDSGYLGFDGIDQFTIAWGNLRNGPLKLKNFSLRVSGRALLFSYTFDASVLATQQLKLWKSNNDTKYTSVIDIDYSTEGKGNFISDHNKEQNTFTTGINADIDRPLHSNGQRIFSKTSATIILIREGDSVTTAVLGGQINPAEAFEDNRFKQLNSFALSNALILVNPLKSFFLTGKLSSIGAVIAGQCIIQFPVRSIDHTLPDPYITSLFDEQRADNANEQPTGTLRATVRWGDAAEPELVLQLEAETGGVPTFKSTLSDEEFAKNILRLPLPHPDKDAFENVLRNALTLAGSPVNVASDEQPYINYKSEYQSNINSAGAYAALHLWPGDISLLDVSGRASQMGIAFTKRVDNAVSSNKAVADNAGYHTNLFYRIEKNQMVTSGRFVRAFTLPHVQWEPIYAKDDNNENNGLAKEIPFPDHGVPTRIASANRADVALAPAAVAKYIVDGFNDEKNEFAAAAHFALPFGMNAVAFFHPFVKDVELRTFKLPKSETKIVIKEPYAYSILSLNQPRFTFKNRGLFGAMQIKVASEGAPNIQRDENELPDPSFHGAVFQTPNVITNIITNVSPPDLTVHKEDSILGDPVTKQFNRVMYGNYVGINGPPALRFKRSEEAKVPLRRIDFSGFGTSVFSNWFNKFANAGGVSQVKFDILVGRVKHEVIQIKSIIIPFFVPVVRTIVIERKNHGNIIRTDSGWVATGPGEFHAGYDCHPGVIKGAYNVTSIKDTSIALAQQLVTPDPDNGSIQNVELAGVYYDADMLIENVVSGFKNTAANFDAGYKLVPSKKQFGYIMLGNAKTALEFYYTNTDLQNFLKRPEVGPLGGPLDCVVNIAGTDQMMHMTRAEVGASLSASLVAAARGTLHFPKGGSWSVVKKLSNGTIAPLNNDETVPLIRHGKLKFKGQRPLAPEFKGSLHVLGTPSEIEKYAASNNLPADIEYALLQSTGTQKMLFPRPSFDANNLSDDKSRVEPQISFAKPLIADPYSLLKSNAIFPNTADAFTLQNVKTGIIANILTITRATDNLSFPKDINDALAEFCPPEAKPAGGKSRKLYLVKEDAFKVYIDYGISDTDDKNLSKQLFTAALNADSKPWEIRNKKVAIVVELASFTPLLTVQGDFTAEPGEKPVFNNAEIIWGSDENLQKIVQVLTILSMLATVEEGGKDLVKEGFSFAMGNSPDSWSYKCTIEEKIPVIQFPNSVQLSQLPGPAPLIVQAGLDLGVFFNLSLSADPNNLIKAGAGIIIGFEATIQVLLISIEVATAYGVGTAKVEVFVELPEAKPTFKFTMGFGATVAVQLPMVGYVSLTRVISLGVAIDHSPTMTVGQMLRGVLTIAGGLASVAVQVEASGTVTDKNAGVEPREWTAIVRGVFSLDVTVAFVVSWDFSEDFEHEIALPNPF